MRCVNKCWLWVGWAEVDCVDMCVCEAEGAKRGKASKSMSSLGGQGQGLHWHAPRALQPTRLQAMVGPIPTRPALSEHLCNGRAKKRENNVQSTGPHGGCQSGSTPGCIFWLAGI